MRIWGLSGEQDEMRNRRQVVGNRGLGGKPSAGGDNRLR